MSANVLVFPANAVCDSCHKATAEDGLSGCFTCDMRVCRNCLDRPCECDKAVADLAAQIADLRPGLMTRLLSRARRVAHSVRVKLAA